MSESRIESSSVLLDSASSAEELFQQGLVLFHREEIEQARVCFHAAHDCEPNHARARSYLGVSVAVCERRFEEALALCTSASKQEFFNPEVYLNLARVYLCFGLKSEGCRFLKRGQMIDPANLEIQQALEELGSRKHPPVRFLPRHHFINRLLGRTRYSFTDRRDTQEAA
jgi:tetratricopeptide (TPR) repeat protein